MKININPNLSQLPVIDYRDPVDIQGGLKELKKSNYARLRSSLINQGLLSPFVLWKNPQDEKLYLIDGNQRRYVFRMENVEPIKIPYLLVPGANAEEAKKNLLAISSQFGTVTNEGYLKFTFDIQPDWLSVNTNFDSLKKNRRVEFNLTPKADETTEDVKNGWIVTVTINDMHKAEELHKRLTEEGYAAVLK